MFAPVFPVSVSVSVEGQDIVVDITNYLAGTGDDGCSVIAEYRVAYDGAERVVSANSQISVTDLSEETEYNCSIVAINRKGTSTS